MIAIVDYGMGNLRSVEKALQKLGHPVEVTSDPTHVATAGRVILPGVGAFGAAMARLTAAEPGSPALADAVRAAAADGKPVLGICLGMQLLLTESEELGRFDGLNLVPGRVRRFAFEPGSPLKIPHMGWNSLQFPRESRLFQGVPSGAQVYFVHGFYCRPDDPDAVAATCEHGRPFCAGMEAGNLYATQFHPEKSGETGLHILDNFARLT